MTRFLILSATLAVASVLFAVGVDVSAAEFDRCGEHLPYGVPSIAGGATISQVCHLGYASAVDDVRLVPRFVAYKLHGGGAQGAEDDHTLGCLARTDNFHAEDSLPAERRAKPGDYAKSGYDIGHQAPAQDFAWNAAEMSDSFSLANMAPQVPRLNRYGWERLEETVRAWAWSRGDMQIFVGAVFGPADKKIGRGGLDVPVGFWKVIVDAVTDEALAFEMPQGDIPKGDLEPWQHSIDDIERDAGIHLPLPASVDRAARPALWPADLSAWHKAHAEACGG